MLTMLTRALPLVLLACQGTDEYADREVSISPRLEAAPTVPAGSDPAAVAEGTPQGPGAARRAARALDAEVPPVSEDHPISRGHVPRAALLDPDSPRFVLRGRDYEVRAGSGGDAFTWRIEDTEGDGFLDALAIEDDGGVVRPFSGSTIPGVGQPKLVERRRVGDSLEARFDNNLMVTYTPFGRSLRIDVQEPDRQRRGLLDVELGGVLPTSRAEVLRILRVPYFDIACVAALEVGGEVRYLTAWVDPMHGNATQVLAKDPEARGPDGQFAYTQHLFYRAGTRGLRNPLRERIWVTWSDSLDEVLPGMDRPASPERERLGRYFYLSYTNTPFDRATEDLERLHGLGVDDLHVWMHHWQRDGYDTGYPDQVMPPRRQWGGLAGLQAMSARMAQLGYDLALHHNWCFNSVKEPGNSLLMGDGRVRANREGGQYLKPRVALEKVDAVEGELHEAFDTRGTFTDSLTVGFPYVDLDGDEEGFGLVRATLAAYHEILGRLRTVHGAPVVGEGSLGGGNLLFSGSVDALPGSLFISTDDRYTGRNGRYVDVVPDFALGPLHELSVRAGVGPPRRFTEPYRWTMSRGFEPPDRDLKRTMTALLGNADYHWWYQLTRVGSVAREWWDGREAALHLAAPGRALERVTYVDERGRARELAAHLEAGGATTIGAVRVHLEYADGAELWANLTPGPWSPEGRPEDIAPNGYLFVAGDVRAGILVQGGATVQLSESPERRYLDARGRRATLGGLATDGAVGLVPLEEAEGGGWQVFPIPEYTLALDRDGSETLVRLGQVELGAPYVAAGEHQLVFLDDARLETAAEVVTLGADGLRLTLADLERHGATSVRVQPLE